MVLFFFNSYNSVTNTPYLCIPVKSFMFCVKNLRYVAGAKLTEGVAGIVHLHPVATLRELLTEQEG